MEFLTPRGADGGEPEAQAEGADEAAGFVRVDDEGCGQSRAIF